MTSILLPVHTILFAFVQHFPQSLRPSLTFTKLKSPHRETLGVIGNDQVTKINISQQLRSLLFLYNELDKGNRNVT